MGGMYQMLKFAKPHGLKLGLCYVCTCFCSVVIWYHFGIKTSQTCVFFTRQVILEKESSRLGIHRESRENLQFVPCMAAVRTFQRSQMRWRATCTNGWQCANCMTIAVWLQHFKNHPSQVQRRVQILWPQKSWCSFRNMPGQRKTLRKTSSAAGRAT